MFYNYIGDIMIKDINDERLAVRSFAGINNGSFDEFNYDLVPLINEKFDFYDLIHNANDSSVKENGGFLIITNNQYILGYNRGMGTGGHLLAFANAYSVINEGYIGIDGKFHNGKIPNFNSLIKTEFKCCSDYLSARIYYEEFDKNMFGRPVFTGRISFLVDNLENSTISLEQFEMFEQFYNDYNNEIKSITRKYPNFVVSFSYCDENGVKQNVNSKDLDSLYEYLKFHIDYNRKIEDEKKVIGVIKGMRLSR